jgi:ferredoxin, 2Fe-2S
MPKIEFVKKRPALTVERGANLMKALLDSGIPVASSCHGQGVCSKCRVQVIAGRENLSIESEFEKSLRTRLRLKDDFRISCQTTVNGDILIDTAYW